MTIQITLLNSMADKDFETSLDRQAEMGIRVLDLKNDIYGKHLPDLTDEEAHRAAESIKRRGLSTYCFSSELFHSDIEEGLDAYATKHLGRVDRLIELAQILKPHFIRLLAAKTSRRNEFANATQYIEREKPWVLELYREAIDRIDAAGFVTTIENETRDCIFGNPAEVVDFFRAVARDGKVSLTWDVQNFWQMGTFPSMEVYRQLKPFIRYYHLKGGKAEVPGGPIAWAAPLEEASWPVLEITREVISDGACAVFCLNSSHGKRPEGYAADEVWKDLAFLRRSFPELQ